MSAALASAARPNAPNIAIRAARRRRRVAAPRGQAEGERPRTGVSARATTMAACPSVGSIGAPLYWPGSMTCDGSAPSVGAT